MERKTVCALIDCSRNAVMTVPSLKKFITLLSEIGYNAVMLYTEDTYELPGYKLFGYMRGGYTKAELKEIDEFARGLGVEMIPCVQMLAHLTCTIRWGELPRDTEDILLVDDEGTYKYIETVFETMSECFSTRRMHIGLDEANLLGRGRFLRTHDYEPQLSILRRHMEKIQKIASKYGYSLIVWSDMFFNDLVVPGHSIDKMELPDYIKNSLPEGIIPAYWDYFTTTEEKYDAMLYNHRQLSKDVWYTGCIWGWKGIVPHNKFSIRTIRPAIDACDKNGVNNIVVAMWGDDGAECSHYSQLPSIYYVGQYASGVHDEGEIKAGFEKKFGIPFDEYICVDLPNQPGSGKWGEHFKNPAKYMLYSDYFNGYNDYSVNEADEHIYTECIAKLDGIASYGGEYSYVFEALAALCRVLEKKYTLGVKTRRAYKSGDKQELGRLVAERYEPLSELIRDFHSKFSVQWHKENHPSGFDVQDLRIGGLLARTESCLRRLKDYIDGRVDSIPELEVDIVPLGNVGESRSIMGPYLYTPNRYTST